MLELLDEHIPYETTIVHMLEMQRKKFYGDLSYNYAQAIEKLPSWTRNRHVVLDKSVFIDMLPEAWTGRHGYAGPVTHAWARILAGLAGNCSSGSELLFNAEERKTQDCPAGSTRMVGRNYSD
jgi:hypothetical protein